MGLIVRKGALGNIADLTTTSTTQKAPYQLGDVVEVYDDTKKAATLYMYVKARTALSQYGVYMVTYLGADGTQVGAAAVASSTVYVYACVPQVAIASGSFGWVAIQGPCKVTSEGNTTADHFGKAVNAKATATDEASLSVNSICTFATTQTAGSSTVDAYLLGNPVTVA